MSRIGRKPVQVPAGVQVAVEGNTIRIKGPKGELSRELHQDMSVKLEGNEVIVVRPSDENFHRALHGLTRTLVQNMVEGVTRGFSKNLELVGVGYRAAKSGNKLVLTVGYSHPVEMVPPPGIEVEVPNPTSVVVKGSNKELVGQFAAEIREVRPPEPYLGKGIKYAGEH
ncbi:MAG: 50S ribosomal protein L6, partial [Firmicutes bacterium]|nr:50S ribosomal protein L6 [Bacillota bacterium]